MIEFTFQTPQRKMALKTGLPEHVCQIFLSKTPNKILIEMAVQDHLLTGRHTVVMEELGITIKDILDDLYSRPEMPYISALFYDWNESLGMQYFKLYE